MVLIGVAKMNYKDTLTCMFGTNMDIQEANNIITGHAVFEGHKFAVLGVVNGTMLDNKMAADLATFVLQQSKLDLLIIVDSGGQQATHKAELLGLNRYFGHLIKTIQFKRYNGSRVFGLVIGQALGGAFIATALNAEKIYALPEAQISVMWLEAMARVTKIPLAKLEELSKTSPIFAPGAENFYKLGAVEQILAPDKVMPQLMLDLKSATSLDDWRNNGLARGGRKLSAAIVAEVLHA